MENQEKSERKRRQSCWYRIKYQRRIKRSIGTTIEEVKDTKLMSSESYPDEKASEEDMNQMGAAGGNKNKQQT